MELAEHLCHYRVWTICTCVFDHANSPCCGVSEYIELERMATYVHVFYTVWISYDVLIRAQQLNAQCRLLGLRCPTRRFHRSYVHRIGSSRWCNDVPSHCESEAHLRAISAHQVLSESNKSHPRRKRRRPETTALKPRGSSCVTPTPSEPPPPPPPKRPPRQLPIRNPQLFRKNIEILPLQPIQPQLRRHSRHEHPKRPLHLLRLRLRLPT
jgi:hypothetical protein